MAQNVLVCCRFRPPSARELEEEAEKVVEVLEDHTTCKISLPGSTKPKTFNFDYVFDCNASQVDVFMHTAQPMVREIMAGFNTTIFAYGQTGSGKTFTMMGNRYVDAGKGIIPRLVEAVFDAIAEADEDTEFTIKVSYLEIYNEKLKDLLNPEQDNLKIRENSSTGVWVQDLTESYISSYEEVLEVMAIGEKQRSIASTKMNMESSRSHSVFILTVTQVHEKTGSRRASKLTLIDLAGSEKVQKTGAEGQTLKEAQHINKSLSALGLVIKALTSSSKHIPYRDSKLTRLLSDSLGGNSKTCLIIACSPVSSNAEETLSTLGFGSRAKQIKNKPTVNQEKSVAEYKRLLAAAEAKIHEQEALIKALEEDLETLRGCTASTTIIPELKSTSMKELVRTSSDQASTISTSTDDTDSVTDSVPDSSELDDSSYEKDSTGESEEKEVDGGEMKTLSPPLKIDLDLRSDSKGEIESVETKTEKKDQTIVLVSEAYEQDKKKLTLDTKRETSSLVSFLDGDDKDEVSVLKKRMSLMEKEFLLQIEQLKEENLALRKSSRTLPLTPTKVLECPSPPTSPRYEREISPTPIIPLSPRTPKEEQQILELQGEIKRLRGMYEVMSMGLKKKCDQYMHLQIVHQDTKEALATTESLLLMTKKKLAEDIALKKDLEVRLVESDAICQKLFEAGYLWKGKRPIRVPIRGGQKQKEKKKIRDLLGSKVSTKHSKLDFAKLKRYMSQLSKEPKQLKYLSNQLALSFPLLLLVLLLSLIFY